MLILQAYAVEIAYRLTCMLKAHVRVDYLVTS